MTTTNGNRKILDLKRWELCSPAPASPISGQIIATSRMIEQNAIFLRNSTPHHLYSIDNDGWIDIAGASLPGISSGMAIAVGHVGKEQSAFASGSTTTIVLQENLQRDLRGYKIHVTEGPGAGDIRTIKSNTLGANSTVTVTSAFSASTTTSTKYRLIAPRYYVSASGSTASGSFKVYEYATDTWVTLANNPTSSFTQSQMVAMTSFVDDGFQSFATGTATSATSTTLSNSGKSWTTNQWANESIRLTGGTGNGQVRTVSSNTSTQITVSAAWTTTPDSTTTYSIEANDDHLYLSVAGTTSVWRYSQSANTWSTVASRAASPSSGMSISWIHETDDEEWNSESNIRIGRYIYSFRGGSSAVLDQYDIALNSWSTVTYAPDAMLLSNNMSYTSYRDSIYIVDHSVARVYQLNVVTDSVNGIGNYPKVGSGSGIYTAWIGLYRDGATKIPYLYVVPPGTTYLFRQMLIQ